MNTSTQHSIEEERTYGNPIMEEEGHNHFINDLFDEEGAFGEADCAGL